jgi:hypothetical protein
MVAIVFFTIYSFEEAVASFPEGFFCLPTCNDVWKRCGFIRPEVKIPSTARGSAAVAERSEPKPRHV